MLDEKRSDEIYHIWYRQENEKDLEETETNEQDQIENPKHLIW